MKNAVFIMLLLASVAVAAEKDVIWSAPINGLRARLLVFSAEETDSPFCRVLIEMQNVDKVAGQKKIRFDLNKLSLQVTDKIGKQLPLAGDPHNGMSPLWEPTMLPYAGTIRFQISFPGLGYNPKTDKVIVDLGPSKVWIIPQDGTTYWLSGKLTVEKETGDHPHMVWNGTLELPKVEIPKGK